MEAYKAMKENVLLVNLKSTFSASLLSKARVDVDVTVTKIAAIGNIKKVLTARILWMKF